MWFRSVIFRVAIIGFLTAILAWCWPIDRVHFDSTRDLLIARDCSALGFCDGQGPQTSLHGIHQGVLWNDILGLAQLLHLTPLHMGLLLCLAHALAMVLAAQWLKPRNRWIFLGLLLLGSLRLVPVVLWSPTLFLPAITLAMAVTLTWLERRTWALTLACGLLWGLTLDLYLASLPVLLMTCLLGLRAGPRLQGPLVGVLAMGGSMLISPVAWLNALKILQNQQNFVLLAVVLLALLAVGVRKLPPRHNLVALTLAGLLAFGLIGLQHQFESRYLAPAWPFLALLITQALRPKLLITLGIILSIVFWPSNPPPELDHATYTQAYELALELQKNHLGWPQAVQHVHGDDARFLAPATAVFLPQESQEWQESHEWQSMDVFLDPKPRAVPTRIDLDDAVICFEGQQLFDLTCAPLPHDWTPDGQFFPLATRVYALSVLPPRQTSRAFLALQVLPGQAGKLTLLPQFRGDRCPWTPLDRQTTLPLPTQAMTLILTRDFRPPCPEPSLLTDWFPNWQEQVPGPPPPRNSLLNPQDLVLDPGATPRIGQALARVVGNVDLPPGEPDIAVTAQSAQIRWKSGEEVNLRPTAKMPWLEPESRTLGARGLERVRLALETELTENPWKSLRKMDQKRRQIGRSQMQALLPAVLLLVLTLMMGLWAMRPRRIT